MIPTTSHTALAPPANSSIAVVCGAASRASAAAQTARSQTMQSGRHRIATNKASHSHSDMPRNWVSPAVSEHRFPPGEPERERKAPEPWQGFLKKRARSCRRSVVDPYENDFDLDVIHGKHSDFSRSEATPAAPCPGDCC